MALRNARPLTWVPRGLSDAIDGTNAFPGAMASLANLVPAPHTRGVFVARPAAEQLADFASFTSLGQGEALLTIGSRYYGLVASGRFPGHSEPFCYDTSTTAFVPISGVTINNTPSSISTLGDWEPPTMARVGSRVLVTHPGFTGSNLFGWFDISGFTDNGKTGTTHSNTTIDGLSANVLLAGWRPGMTITDSSGDLPAGTRIVSVAANGLSIVVSQAATGSHGGDAFTVSGGTNAAPLWCAGNVNQNPLISRPVAVAQFSGRAYYAVGNAVAFSDTADPLQATDALVVQVITFQNGLNVTALAGLPLDNQLGGIIQSLMVFQGAAIIQQITGDAALTSSNLAVNTLNVAVGTLAPNSIASTPLGLMFIAPDGLRLIDFTGHVSEPIGANGDGISLPFINATNPSRISAAYNEDVYRVTVTSAIGVGGEVLNSTQSLEYWYHLKLKTWTGPHSFPFRLIAPSQTSLAFVGFAMTANVLGLWQSASLPSNVPGLVSSYTENGAVLSYLYRPVLMPDNQEMAENCVVESTIMISLGSTTTPRSRFSTMPAMCWTARA
jgi:hypothetical protein